MPQYRSLPLTLVLMTLSATVSADDWPQFRGPRGDGVSQESDVPLEWSGTENIRWKVELPGPGNGSPIVSNGRVFITGASEDGKERSLTCFDRTNGEQLWVRTVEYNKVEPTHDTNPYGSSTPAADGERVVVWHGSAGAHCYDFEGNPLWSKDLGEFVHIWGYGASPVIYHERVLLNCGPGERQFMAALDLRNGDVLWQTDEPGGGDGSNRQNGWIGSWSTPVVVNIDGRDQIVCSQPTRVVAYNPEDGKILWFCEGLANLPRGNLVYMSPVIAGDIGVVLGGFNGPGIGFKLGGEGNVTETNLLWREEKGNPQRIGTGVFHEGYIYHANSGPGTVQCIEPATGKTVWEARPQAGGNFWGSVVMAAGRLYVTNQNGTMIAFAPNPEKFELLATNELREHSNSTPAVSDGEFFLRTYQHLYCVGKQ